MPDPLLQHLRRTLGPLEVIESLDHGAWSRAFRIRREEPRSHPDARPRPESDGAGDLVVRVSETPENFQRDAEAYELAGDKLPIPRILETGEIEGRHFAVSEFRAGEHFELLSPEELRPLVDEVVSLCRGLSEVDLSEQSGFGYWDRDLRGEYESWAGYLLDVIEDRPLPSNLIHGWRSRLQQSGRGMTEFKELHGVLRGLAAALPEERHLIHSDLLNYNVLARDGRITAVLDWGCAKFGDPLYDLAWFEFYEPWYPAFREVGLVAALGRAYPGFLENADALSERRLACAIHIGLDSMAYNAYRDDMPHYEEARDRAWSVIRAHGR